MDVSLLQAKKLASYVLANFYKNNFKNKSMNELAEEIYNTLQSCEYFSDANIIDTEIVKSDDINTVNSNIFVDLVTSYMLTNIVEEQIYKNSDIYNSFFQMLNIEINKIKDNVNSYKLSMAQLFNPYHIIENFRDISNKEDDEKYYTERYGEVSELDKFKAYYDSSNEEITLPLLKHDNMLYKDNVSYAYISINRQNGRTITQDDDNHSLSNIIDLQTSYWTQSIYSDEELKPEYNDKKDTNNIADYMYNIKNGAVCEFEINYDSRTMINEIRLSPCSKYPMEIIAIRYKETDDPEENWSELISPEMTIPELQNKILTYDISYKFREILVKHLYILFRQIHYSIESYTFDEGNLFKNSLFFNSKYNENIKTDENTLFAPLQNDVIKDIPLYNYIYNNVENNNLDINSLIFGETKPKNLTKYKYSYGFYNIGTYNNDFNMIGIYVLEQESTLSGIKNLSLTTKQSLPKDIDNIPVCDIEYYLTTKENPTYKDWLSILPKNVSVIECELLQIEDSKCILRFPADSINYIKKNNNILQINVDYFTHINNDCIDYISIPNFDFNSVYVANYNPNKAAYNIEFDDDDIYKDTTDIIQCNNSISYELSQKPIIFENSFVMSLLSKKGEYLSEQNGAILNVTNNISPEDSYKNFDSTNQRVQYYIYNSNIYLNKAFDDNYSIYITYKSYISSFRTKIILRKNTDKSSFLTPSVQSIDYEISTID